MQVDEFYVTLSCFQMVINTNIRILFMPEQEKYEAIDVQFYRGFTAFFPDI
jgi:hypothetical protein